MKYSLFPFFAFSCSLLTDNYAVAVVINNGEEKLINNKTYYGVTTVGSDSDGKLTVSEGGELTTNIFRIGFNGGNGEANVINGGKVIISASNYAYPFGIGGSGDSTGDNGSINTTGVLNISGAGSQVTSTSTIGDFTVGNKGAEGYLNISDGGKLIVKQGVWVGSRGGEATKGFVRVQGNDSELSTDERFIVGTWNYGMAVISDGAKLTANGSNVDAISVGNQRTNQKDNLVIITGDNTTATATNGGVVVGVAGKGTLVVADNATLSSTKEIVIARDYTANGELAIGNRKGEQATGAGSIDAESIRFGAGTGVLVFNHTDNDFTLDAAIHGKGTVEVLSGVTILTGANDYTGNTLIGDAGVLQAGAANTFSSNSSYTINEGGGLFLNGYNQTISTLNNAGVTNLSGATAGSLLTITGDYVGVNGQLLLGTQLGGDNSLTDKLVIEGNASGTTLVSVNNMGGSGAQTVEGIKIIEVKGISDDGAFIQNGRIVAGAYDYSLIKGSATGQDKQSWYLTSLYNGGSGSGGNSAGGIHAIRPEAMGYLSNLSMANTMFNLRLQDRQPETTYIDPVTGQTKTSTLWLRHQYGFNEFEDSTGSLTSKSNRNIIQLGGDIAQWSTNGSDRFHLGAMAGSGYSHGRAESKLTKYHTRTELSGYSMGLYGTWYQNDRDKTGLYIDSWLLWNHFTAKVNGQELQQEKYHLQGVTSSLEMGYTLNLGQLRQGYELWLQPQTQLTWQGVKADKHTENNGTLVRANRDNLQTRLGARVMLVPEQSSELARPIVSPYLEANWIHHSKSYGVSMDSEGISQAGTKNIAEIKAGIEGNITQNTSLWLNVGHQFSSNSYRDTTTTLGVKFSF